jgi:hypothetical protein
VNSLFLDPQLDRDTTDERDELPRGPDPHPYVPVVHVTGRLERPGEEGGGVVETHGGIKVFDVVVGEEVVDLLELEKFWKGNRQRKGGIRDGNEEGSNEGEVMAGRDRCETSGWKMG